MTLLYLLFSTIVMTWET